MEIWTGVTDASLTHSLTTLKDSATQLLIKFKTGALVSQQEQEVLADLKCNYCMIYIVFPAPCCPHFKGHLWLWNISDGDEMA